MSNITNTPLAIRRQLLCTVSALALLVSACGDVEAAGGDADHPLIWIEVGGQMENITGQGEVFAPAFLSAYATSPVFQKVTPLQAQKPPMFGFGESATISFQPESSDWIFSAAIRYGRSSSSRNVHHQTTRVFSQEYKYTPGRYYKTDLEKFSNTLSHHRERNTVLDFSAGKDVGLGLFGSQASSVLKAGVRFAQFTSNSSVDMRARPDLYVKYITFGAIKFPISKHFHTYHATEHASRSFSGVGPSLSWNGSVPFTGNVQHGEIAFDWGVNASVLFGKQRARVRHQESGHYKPPGGSLLYTTVYPASPVSRTNARSVSVPNVGGMAGISFRRGDAKISFGYRADFFFGAMDAGIDARKSETLGFKGPFASISVGLGD